MPRRALPVLVVLIAAALIAWVVWPDSGERVLPEEQRPAATTDSPDLLNAEGELERRAPALAGRPPPAPEEVEPGIPETPVQTMTEYVVRLAAVDAETGDPVSVELWGAGQPLRINFIEGHEPTTVMMKAGEPIRLGSYISTSDEWVAWYPTIFGFVPSRLAKSILLRFPLRRVVPVSVEVRAADGDFAAGAAIFGFVLGGRIVERAGPRQYAREDLRVPRVPYFRDTAITVLAGDRRTRALLEADREVIEMEDATVEDAFADAEPLPGAALARGRLPERWGEALVLYARLPAAGQPGARWPVRVMSDFTVDYDEVFGLSDAEKDTRPRGTVRVTVRDRRGDPAVGVRVWVETTGLRTGPDGTVTFDAVPVGSHVVALTEPGMVRTKSTVTVTKGGQHAVALQEREGGTLAVHVVDENGRGLPAARVELSTATGNVPIEWADEDEGVQLVDPFTDHRGRRTFEHADPGKAKVTATWADRSGSVETEIREGEASVVTIRLRSPADVR